MDKTTTDRIIKVIKMLDELQVLNWHERLEEWDEGEALDYYTFCCHMDHGSGHWDKRFIAIHCMSSLFTINFCGELLVSCDDGELHRYLGSALRYKGPMYEVFVLDAFATFFGEKKG